MGFPTSPRRRIEQRVVLRVSCDVANSSWGMNPVQRLSDRAHQKLAQKLAPTHVELRMHLPRRRQRIRPISDAIELQRRQLVK